MRETGSRETNRYDLVVIGDLVADIIVPVTRLPLRADEHGWADGLFTELGGACTTLVAARRMNLSVAALGMVGEDEYGAKILNMLAGEGVDVSHVFIPPGRQTVLCVVITDRKGEHVFLGIKDHRPQERCPPAWLEIVRQARSVFANGYTLLDMLDPGDVLTVLQGARAEGVPIFFDPGPSITVLKPALLEQVLSTIDVLLLTAEESRHVTDAAGADAARALQLCGPRVVVLKMGPAGCIVAAGDELIEHPGFDVQVVDTVGAGDAFVGAFIAGYLRGGSWQECAALANAMGAAVAAARGAGRRVPGAGRVVEILAGDGAGRLVGVDGAAEDLEG